MVFWTIGILLILGLTWFTISFAIPVAIARPIVAKYNHEAMPHGAIRWGELGLGTDAMQKTSIDRFASKYKAARCLEMYICAPDFAAPYRSAAVELLGACGKAGVNPLVKICERRSPEVRAEALMALGCIGQDAHEATPVLLKSLSDSEPNVRIAAILALSNVGVDTYTLVPALMETLRDQEWEVRWMAADVLAVTVGPEDREIVAALIPALSDISLNVRHSVAQALGRIGTPALDAVPALEHMRDSGDEHPSVRAAAAEALKKIRGEEPSK
jgi:hypothetical protein